MAGSPAYARPGSAADRPAGVAAAALMILLSLAVGGFLLWESGSHTALQRSLDQLQLPGGVSLVSTERHGSRLCLGGCPVIVQEYRSALDPMVARDGFAAAFQRDGFTREPETGRCAASGGELPGYADPGFERSCWTGGDGQELLLTVAQATDRPETVVLMRIAETGQA